MKTIPILPVLGVAAPAIAAWNDNGKVVNSNLVYQLGYRYTGHDFKSGSGTNWSQTTLTLGSILFGIVGHKVASKIGVNKYIKKATFGWLSL